MARLGEPRIVVRMSHEEKAIIERCARVAGVANASLLRECALRWGPVLAAAIASGERPDIRQRLRARNADPPTGRASDDFTGCVE